MTRGNREGFFSINVSKAPNAMRTPRIGKSTGGIHDDTGTTGKLPCENQSAGVRAIATRRVTAMRFLRVRGRVGDMSSLTSLHLRSDSLSRPPRHSRGGEMRSATSEGETLVVP